MVREVHIVADKSSKDASVHHRHSTKSIVSEVFTCSVQRAAKHTDNMVDIPQ